MPFPATNAITIEDRKSILTALRAEGYDRVMREKGDVLNKYFSKPKTTKEVNKLLRHYVQKSKSYNKLHVDRSSFDGEVKKSLSSTSLFKWHHILPQPGLHLNDILADSVLKISETFIDSGQQVLAFLSSLLKGDERPHELDSSACLTILSLLADLETDVVAKLPFSKPLIDQMSESFWKLLHEAEGNVPLSTDEADDTMVRSLDPFKLFQGLKFQERLVRETVESMDFESVEQDAANASIPE